MSQVRGLYPLPFFYLGALTHWLSTCLSSRTKSVRFRYASPTHSLPGETGRHTCLRSRRMSIRVRVSGKAPTFSSISSVAEHPLDKRKALGSLPRSTTSFSCDGRVVEGNCLQNSHHHWFTSERSERRTPLAAVPRIARDSRSEQNRLARPNHYARSSTDESASLRSWRL
jgi:hypothetical protein